jgi:type II secretion system protein C
MKAIFNEFLIRRFNLLALPVVIVWSFLSIGGVFLSSTPIEGFTYRLEPFFEIFHFGKQFGIVKSLGGTINSKTVMTQTLVPYPHRIKAIYRSSSGSFVSISDDHETQIVPLGGVYKGAFHLIGLSDNSAIFSGYGQKYRLRLGHDDPLSRHEMVSQSVSDTQTNGSEEEIHKIAYQTVLSQMNDFQNIWKSIDISESRNGTKFMGFRVNSIASESIFAQLGLQQGDIIQSVNNQKLESFGDAITIYSKVPHLRSVQITVLRNNLQKDIVYEITR